MIINFWTNHANVNNSAEVELFVNGRLRWGTLAMGGHGSLQKERFDLGFSGEPRRGEAHFLTGIFY
jgi:hypothetical protein